MFRSSLLLLLLLSGAACRDSGGSFVRDSGVGEADGGFVDGALADASASDAAPGLDAIPLNNGDGAVPSDGGLDPDAGFPLDTGPGLDGGVGLAPGPGDLVFVEIQGNPQNTADTDAEYFELINVSGRDLDLQGCRLTHRLWAGSGNAPVMSVGNHLINASVPVAAGARVLLTHSAGGFFGGATRDYVYGGFEISNGGADSNRLRLMTPSWDGSEPPSPAHLVDEVIAPPATFDNPVRGQAWQLNPTLVPSPTAAANDDPANWCYAPSNGTLAYWQSNWGTPRAANVCN